MKTNTKYIIAVCMLCVGITQSCKKDFLNKNPLDVLSTQTFWKSDVDVQQALAGVYATLQNSDFYAGRKPWLDAYSDDAYDRDSYYGFDILTQGFVNSTNVTDAFYGPPYRGIAACNYFLDNVSKAPISALALNQYSAEVKFLRAMYYFDLVQAYGGVVVYKTTPATVLASKISQSSQADVLTFVNSDLDFAIANLPDVSYAGSGHAVKAAAQAEKARVALFQKNWELAVSLTGEIMSSKKFSIDASYSGIFLNATQQTSNEIIFSDKYLRPNDVNNMNSEIGAEASVAPVQNLVDEYETTSGKMITDPMSGYNPASPYVNRDPRLGFTIQVPGDDFTNPDGSPFTHNDPLVTGYASKKYVDFSQLPFVNTLVQDQNVVLIRYADVLLMYAEAKNELSGPDPTVYAAINQIRQRPTVNMPPVSQAVYNTQSSLREFIRHERRIEFAMEGWRYYDLKRWGIMEQKLSQMKNPGGIPLKFGEKNNVLPFSQSELIANPQLKQNVGY